MNLITVPEISQFFEAVDKKARTARLRKVKLHSDKLFKMAGDNWQGEVADKGRKAHNIVAKFKGKAREKNMSMDGKIWAGKFANARKANEKSEAVDQNLRAKRIYALGKLAKNTKVAKSDYSNSNNLKHGVVRRLKAIIAKHKDSDVRRKQDMGKLWLNHDAMHARSAHKFFKNQSTKYGK